MSKKELEKKIQQTVNTLPQCNSKCRVHDLTIECDENASKTEIKVTLDVTIFNPHPNEVPLNCSTSCKRASMVGMLRDAFAISNAIKSMVKMKGEMFELSGKGLPSLDKTTSLKDKNMIGKPQMLCDPGQVLTRTRLCGIVSF